MTGCDSSPCLEHDGIGTWPAVVATIAGPRSTFEFQSPHVAKKSEVPRIFYDPPRSVMTGDERDNIDKWWMEEQLPRNYRVAGAFPVSLR